MDDDIDLDELLAESEEEEFEQVSEEEKEKFEGLIDEIKERCEEANIEICQDDGATSA